MTRERVAQQPPAVALDDFPEHVLDPVTTMHRAHHRDRGPWWFSSEGGRFDLRPPRGTCYLADDPLVALRERLGVVLGARPTVPAAMLDGAVVSALHVEAVTRLADLRSRRTTRFGVTRELDTMVPYAVPQAWARGFDAVGLQGVRYSPRFSTGQAASWALFDAAGAGSSDRAVDPDPTPGVDVPGAPVAVEPPRLWDLTVVRPPRTRGPR